MNRFETPADLLATLSDKIAAVVHGMLPHLATCPGIAGRLNVEQIRQMGINTLADLATSTHKVKAGSGTTLKKIRHPYPTEAEANRATESTQTGAVSAAMTLNATIPGFEPRLFGGGLVQLAGLRAELDGEWHLKNVTHELSSTGLITSLHATKGRSEAT